MAKRRSGPQGQFQADCGHVPGVVDAYRAQEDSDNDLLCEAVTIDKDSGIVNDANLWAIETMHNTKYPIELFLRVITVSLETNRIVASFPKLEI